MTRPKTEWRHVQIRIEKNAFEQLEQRAEADFMSVTHWVRRAVMQALQTPNSG